MSPLTTFLERLFSDGKTLVNPGPQPVLPDAASENLLRKAYLDDAWHFPGKQPALDQAVATNAAVWLYHAAMCYADRSMTADLSERLLAPPAIEHRDASAHYSADLVLRHLPALHELAAGLAEGDPVLTNVKRMAWLWPLSSVGVRLPEPWGAPDVGTVQSHPGLWRLFLDRVIASGEANALRDDVTRAASRHSLGLHPDLALRLLPHWQDVEPRALPLPSAFVS